MARVAHLPFERPLSALLNRAVEEALCSTLLRMPWPLAPRWRGYMSLAWNLTWTTQRLVVGTTIS